MNKHNTRIVEAARELLKANGYFVDHLWHVDDIHFICEQNNITDISDEEAMEVFGIVVSQFDGENGVSWPQLEKALHTFMHRKNVLRDMCENKS